MTQHLNKEEQILFPMIRQLEASADLPIFHCGTLANPIRRMQLEHEDAGMTLTQLRHLTQDYTPADGACNTYRALFDALAYFEQDMHQHVHKENNILFPRVLELEQTKSGLS